MVNNIFKNLDLNLLRLFIVLSQEKNMRKAALKMHVSQPAISQSLQKLRDKLNDELFIKVRTGLEPTKYAEELYDQIFPHYNALHNIIDHTRHFEPSQLDTTLKIALSPLVLASLSGTLFYKIKEFAPLVNIELVSWNSTTFEDIQNNDILLGINHAIDYPSNMIQAQQLMELSGRIIVRKEHPMRGAIYPLSAFENVEIASVLIPGWNDDKVLAAEILEAKNIQYSVGFRSEFIMAIIDVIRHTDMVMPESNLFPISLYPDLRAIDITIDELPHLYPVQSYSHLRNKHNPIVTWLNELITDVLRQQANDNKQNLLQM